MNFVHRHLPRFARYLTVGATTFGLDLLLLYATTEHLGIAYWIAAPACFGFAVSLNYVFSRWIAFPDSTRTTGEGYLMFLGIAIGGAVAITLTLSFFVGTLGFPLLPTRVGIGLLVGLWNYVANAQWNFRVFGKVLP